MKHKELREYVDRIQRQYETALTRALKIKTTLQHKFKYATDLRRFFLQLVGLQA